MRQGTTSPAIAFHQQPGYDQAMNLHDYIADPARRDALAMSHDDAVRAASHTGGAVVPL